MAQVDCEVDLIMLRDVINVFLVLHVYRHKLVADFRRMLCIVYQAELLGLYVVLQFWVVFESYTFTLDFLSPAIFVQTFSEEDHVGQHNFVIELVDTVAHSV